MSKVLITIRSTTPSLSVESVKQRYGLADHEIDKQFGVVQIDPEAGKYTVLVEMDAASRIRGDENVQGPYVNARIATFSP